MTGCFTTRPISSRPRIRRPSSGAWITGRRRSRPEPSAIKAASSCEGAAFSFPPVWQDKAPQPGTSLAAHALPLHLRMEDSMTAADKNRALDRNETEWVKMSRAAAHLTDTQLTDLLRRLRERRDRAQRMIRTRTRQASREGQ